MENNLKKIYIAESLWTPVYLKLTQYYKLTTLQWVILNKNKNSKEKKSRLNRMMNPFIDVKVTWRTKRKKFKEKWTILEPVRHGKWCNI